ncbi:MAG: adenylate/guanylate cyclase domain-containing protein [Solirubrobacterales bacterium]
MSGATASNIETQWELPEVGRLMERLGRFARVIRYDRRDSGLSDPIAGDLTLEAHAEDALAVMDAVGSDRPVLVGSTDGARSLALLAATRPERVGGLIALAPTVKGASANSPEIAEAATAGLEDFSDWPQPILEWLAPDWMADEVRRERLTRYVQTSTSPGQARRILRMSLVSDISDVLHLVQAPVLAVYPADLALVDGEVVRQFADQIPGGAYREIPGASIFLFGNDTDRFADVVEEFVTGNPPTRVSSRILATVLFTDLVDSTRLATELGDEAWSEVLDRHFARARAAVSAHDGETIKTTGDGILAIFTGPARAVRCAETILADASDLDLDVRAGLHAGELQRSPDDVAGVAVHLAARIMGLADGGEILVSRTVRDLVIGGDLVFAERGEEELKGIPGRWPVFAVE